MTIVPETRIGKIQFYETHLPRWGEDPASIGVTPEAVETLSDLVAEARDAFNAHAQAQQAARAATATFHEKVQRMHSGLGGGAYVLQTIKTFAASSGDPDVYPRAEIPVPSSPGRPGSAPAPGQPFGFDVQLFQYGGLRLTWKCGNPDGTAGTIYQVRRQLNGEGNFIFIAAVGAEKSFLDETLPAGTRTCVYEVTAVRSTRRGALARYAVNFGGVAPRRSVQLKAENLAA